MKYLPLFNLHLTHQYYTDGRCPDFQIEASADTLRLLKNYRCVLRQKPGGVQVLAAVTDRGVPFIPMQKEAPFAFHLRLQNPDFALFTDLTELTQTAAPRYTNADLGPGDPVQLALVSPRVRSIESFVVREPAREDAFTLSGRPQPGLRLTDFAVEGLGAVKQFDAPAKILTVNSSTAKTGDIFAITYPVAPQLGRGVFADVEIHLNNSVPEIPDGPGEFQVSFKAKRARWKYYVVAGKSDSEFRIEDRDASPLVFSDKNRTHLNRHPDVSDDVAKAIAEQYPDQQRVRFVSDEQVPCRQSPRKQLQLCLNGTRVWESLPNPSLRNYTVTEVTVNRSRQQEAGLFHVMKYFAHPSLKLGG